MRNLTIVFAALIGLYACGQSVETTDDVANVPVSNVSLEGDVDKTIAKIRIEGMMCEMACGGKIKKELGLLAGVTKADIVFQDSLQQDWAVVEFDPGQIKPENFIECVQGIAKGAYKVQGVDVINYEKSAENEAAESELSINFDKLVPVPGIFKILILQ